MWLIETRTLKLKFVTDARQEKRPYAILSHTWVDGEEVNFQEFHDIEDARKTRPSGFAKIQKTCELALKEQPPLEYCWVDTCCIDKTSSAELTEAINSMYRWYKESAVCYAFLVDLAPGGSLKDLGGCRWFMRGWTLQELVAPRIVVFFDRAWGFRGTKKGLKEVLSSITGIPEKVLRDGEEAFGECIAKRMSWAAKRQTTRVEDRAYCLLGLFGVYMPMIYGEGARAFMRLQEELIKDNHDRSIFAWKAVPGDQEEKYRGILAHGPDEFAHCGKFGKLQMAYRSHSDFVLTNRGVRFEGRLPLSQRGTLGYLLDLECCDFGQSNKMWIGILMEKTGKNGYVRSEPRDLRYFDRFLDDRWYPRYISLPRYFAARDLHRREIRAINLQYALSIQVHLPKNATIISVGPEELWDPAQTLFWTLGADTFIGYILFRVSTFQQDVECLLACGTRRPDRADSAALSKGQCHGSKKDDEKKAEPKERGRLSTADNDMITEGHIDRRFPWCYTWTNRGQWRQFMMGNNSNNSSRDHDGGGGLGASALFDSRNFLSQLWRAAPDAKPAAHESTYRFPGSVDAKKKLDFGATMSIGKIRGHPAFRADVDVSGDALDGSAGRRSPKIGVVQYGGGQDDNTGDDGRDGVTSESSKSKELLVPLPLTFRHVEGRSRSRSPPGGRQSGHTSFPYT